VLLSEWRSWWTSTGADELRSLLIENWDPLREHPDLRGEFAPVLLAIGRELHEGGDLIDVKLHLAQFREDTQGRTGRRWGRRDRRVAEKVVRWYREATGEPPDRFTDSHSGGSRAPTRLATEQLEGPCVLLHHPL